MLRFWRDNGRDPFHQNSDRSDRKKRTTSKGGPVFSKLFRLDRTDPLSFGPKFPESLVEWIAPNNSPALSTFTAHQTAFLLTRWFLFLKRGRLCWRDFRSGCASRFLSLTLSLNAPSALTFLATRLLLKISKISKSHARCGKKGPL